MYALSHAVDSKQLGTTMASLPLHVRLLPHAERLPAATALSQQVRQRSHVLLLGLSHSALPLVVFGQGAECSTAAAQCAQLACACQQVCALLLT